MIRIIILEDHPVIISGLRNMLRPSRDGIDIVGSSTDVDNVRKLSLEFPGKPEGDHFQLQHAQPGNISLPYHCWRPDLVQNILHI